MKLIRLHTSNPNGFFETQFNTEVVVDPNSKIALQSATFKSALQTLAVTNQNYRMTFVLTNLTDGSSDNLGITLDPAFYTDVNYNDLFKDIQKKFNETMLLNKNTLGIDFRVRLDDQNKVNIGYKRSYFTDFELLEDAGLIGENTGVAVNGFGMSNSVDVANVDDRIRVISGLPIGSGMKVFRVQLKELVNTTDGCKIGLTNTGFVTANVVDADFYIQSHGDSQPYTFLSAKGAAIGTSTFNSINTGLNPDFVEISVEGNEIVGSIYRETQANRDVLFRTPYSENDNIDFYPFVSIQAKSSELELDHVSYTYDMFFLEIGETPITRLRNEYKNLGKNHDKHVTLHLAATAGFTAVPVTPRPVAEVLQGRLTMARNMADYLAIVNKVSLADETQFTDDLTDAPANLLIISARDVFHGNIQTNNYLIELNSIDIDSYDSLEGRRKNIIASIPQQEQIGIIDYEPNNLYFVDTKNNHTLSLRNINCRILNIDGSTPQLEGVSVINLLVLSPNE